MTSCGMDDEHMVDLLHMPMSKKCSHAWLGRVQLRVQMGFRGFFDGPIKAGCLFATYSCSATISASWFAHIDGQPQTSMSRRHLHGERCIAIRLTASSVKGNEILVTWQRKCDCHKARLLDAVRLLAWQLTDFLKRLSKSHPKY